MPFEYRRRRIDKRTPEQALVLLRDAAKHFGYREFGKRDLNAAKLGISSTGVQNAFGSWSAGVSALRAVLAEDGIVLVPRTRQVASDDDLFGEMQRVWTAVGHRPSQYEWQAASPAYHYNTYRSRFGGWSNACLLFLEWQMGESLEVGAASPAASRSACPTPGEFAPPPIEKRRNPPDRLRLRVLDRDGYRCVLCGRSPATEVGVVLHLDHIMPVADGGLTTYENLRTLCQQCNLGRGRDMQLGRGSV